MSYLIIFVYESPFLKKDLFLDCKINNVIPIDNFVYTYKTILISFCVVLIMFWRNEQI